MAEVCNLIAKVIVVLALDVVVSCPAELARCETGDCPGQEGVLCEDSGHWIWGHDVAAVE